MSHNLKKITRNFLENYLETKARIEFRISQIKALEHEVMVLPYSNFGQKLTDMPKAKNKKSNSKQEIYAIKKQEIDEKINMLKYNNAIDNIIITFIETKHSCLKSDLHLIITLKFMQKAKDDKAIMSEYQKEFEYISEKSFYRKLNKAITEMSFDEKEYLELLKYTEID